MQVSSAAAQERGWWSLASSAASSCSRLDAAAGSDGDLSPTHSVRSSLSGSRPGSNGAGGGLTKKVSFADDLGMLLEQVRRRRRITILDYRCLQCFDAVGWAAGRASGL